MGQDEQQGGDARGEQIKRFRGDRVRMRIKNNIKQMSVVLFFFLAKIHNRIKSDNGDLNQPIVKRLLQGGRHKYNGHATGLQRSAPP